MQRVAIDIDEVLAPFLPTMLKWRPPKQPLPKKFPYYYKQIYGITAEDARRMVAEFYDSEAFAEMTPIKGSQQGIKTLKDCDKRLYIVTGRQNFVRDKTEQWIEKWFPNMFADLVMTDSYTNQEIRKVDICKMLNIGLLVDDNIITCLDCQDAKIKALNFVGDPMYPWAEKSSMMMSSWGTVPELKNLRYL